jgi:DNA-binding transcriptional LysR family regulator
MIDLRRLRCFVAVAEELHFGRAARRLNMTQPPLSVQIRELEREIGAPLLTRTQRRVELTAAGATLLAEARRLLAQADAAIERTRRSARGELGHLTIGFVSTADYSLLPPLVRRFRARHPGIGLTLRELTGDRQLEQLAQGGLDLGLMYGPLQASGLVGRTVLRERLIAALPAAHPLARRRAVAATALRDDGLILFPRALAPGLYDQAIGICQRAGFAPRIVQEAVQMQTILGLVAAGLGAALVPACMALLKRPDVAYLPLAPAGPQVETIAVWRAGDASPVLVALLRELPGASGSAQLRDAAPRVRRAGA